uniref:response regulator transcription factor n=1 Tax=Eubacterium cellulosolvens TaxID=29322 RepID=UPI00047FD921|nr:response regulator transcription factor [[Eubacterium] cellulosolvens]
MLDIIIVEDHKEIAGVLLDFLKSRNYRAEIAPTAERALELFEEQGAKLIILDLMLPGLDGYYVCSKIRETSNAHILIVSARNSKEDKLKGLNIGADDFIEKPYDIDILLAKIDGIFKRKYAVDELKDANITLNIAKQSLFVDEKEVEITAKEFELLKLLMENKGVNLKKEFLFNSVWGYDSDSEQQTLTVHIKHLREKIEKDPKHPAHIITQWGKGYRYE